MTSLSTTEPWWCWTTVSSRHSPLICVQERVVAPFEGHFYQKQSMVQLVKNIFYFVSCNCKRGWWASGQYVKVVQHSNNLKMAEVKDAVDAWNKCKLKQGITDHLRISMQSSAEIQPSPTGDMSKNQRHQALLKKTMWRSASQCRSFTRFTNASTFKTWPQQRHELPRRSLVHTEISNFKRFKVSIVLLLITYWWSWPSQTMIQILLLHLPRPLASLVQVGSVNLKSQWVYTHISEQRSQTPPTSYELSGEHKPLGK